SSPISRCMEESTRLFTSIHQNTTYSGEKSCREQTCHGGCLARILPRKARSTTKPFLSAIAFGLVPQNLPSLHPGCRALNLGFVSAARTSSSAFCTVVGLVSISRFSKREKSPPEIQ